MRLIVIMRISFDAKSPFSYVAWYLNRHNTCPKLRFSWVVSPKSQAIANVLTAQAVSQYGLAGRVVDFVHLVISNIDGTTHSSGRSRPSSAKSRRDIEMVAEVN